MALFAISSGWLSYSGVFTVEMPTGDCFGTGRIEPFVYFSIDVKAYRKLSGISFGALGLAA
jgi:hypothetical protein